MPSFGGPHQNSLLAVLDPSLCGEVGGFCTVETVVETSMIGVRERYHELTSLLSNLQERQKDILVTAVNTLGFVQWV